MKVLDLMGWKCFFGDEALTRQVSRVIRCADSSEAPSYYSPQVFRLKVSDFWLSVTHSWVFLKLNFLSKGNSSSNTLQKCTFLEVILISSLLFFFFFAKPPQVEGVVLFHLIYVSDKIQEVFLRLSYHLNSNDGLVIGRVVVAAVI